jgi:hypothetical protein
VKGFSLNKTSAGRNMGCNVVCEAEAASPLPGKIFGNYHAAHVQWSASRQIIAEANHINDVTHTGSIEGIQVKENFESMIASKEPDHSLGGYSHRECWSRTR